MHTSASVPAIPASIRCNRRGSCVPVALYCLPQLVEGRDIIVEGWVSFGSGLQEHTWMVVDGQIFDPTLIQFRRFRGFGAGPTYSVSRTITPAEFRAYWYFLKSSWWRDRLESFGVPLTSWVFA